MFPFCSQPDCSDNSLYYMIIKAEYFAFIMLYRG